MIRQRPHPVQHPAQRRLQQRAVQQIHREAHPAQEQQVPAAERPLQGRAEQDAERDELQPNAGAVAREVRICGEDGAQDVEQEVRPGHPLREAFRERGEAEPDEDEDAGGEGGCAWAACDEGCDGVGVLEVREEGAPEKLHAEGSCAQDPVSQERCHQHVSGEGKEERLTVRSTPKISPQPQARQHPKPRPHKRRRQNKRIHKHAAPHQWQQRPLILIILIQATRPCPYHIPHQTTQRRTHASHPHGAINVDPPAIRVLSNRIQPQLTQPPADRARRRRGQHEPRDAAQRGAADARERGLGVPGAQQRDGLERTYVARHEGEDGDAQAALGEHADVGELQEARRRVVGGRGEEEGAVPGAAEVCEDYGCGGEAAEALWGEGKGLVLGHDGGRLLWGRGMVEIDDPHT